MNHKAIEDGLIEFMLIVIQKNEIKSSALDTLGSLLNSDQALVSFLEFNGLKVIC